jgi:tRNA A37 threonylcarbamoyladenosine biosynthesis protein TsaE
VLVYHIDLYRLDTLAEVRGIGLNEVLASPAIVLLEWAERFPKSSLCRAARSGSRKSRKANGGSPLLTSWSKPNGHDLD